VLTGIGKERRKDPWIEKEAFGRRNLNIKT
jgi:hypothetical protein